MGAECLALRARMLSRVVTQIYEEALRPLGLKPSQHSILAALAMMDDPRPSDLAAALRLEPSTVSRNLAVMVRSGWVEERPAEDERTRRVGLSHAGADLLREALPHWRKAQRKAHALLSDEGRDALVGIIDRLGVAPPRLE
jgi:DNA-binding MarR family transcriptional regulator